MTRAPHEEPEAPIEVIHVVGAAVLRGGSLCLVTRRGPHVRASGKWEFPGGKVEPGERPEDALRRELREELGIEVAVGSFVGTGLADQGGHRIRLDVYTAVLLSGEPELTDHDACAWLGPNDLAGLDWAAADVPVVPSVQRILIDTRSSE